MTGLERRGRRCRGTRVAVHWIADPGDGVSRLEDSSEMCRKMRLDLNSSDWSNHGSSFVSEPRYHTFEEP